MRIATLLLVTATVTAATAMTATAVPAAATGATPVPTTATETSTPTTASETPTPTPTPDPVSIPTPSTPPPLTLAAVLERVRRESPRLAAARALVEGAEAGARAAGRIADPTLDLLSENWRGGDFDARTELDLTAAWVQPLEIWGTRSGRRAVAAGDADEARAGLALTAREVELEAVRLFLATLDGQEMTRALEAQADRLRVIVARLERQVAEGYAAEARLAKFTSERARVELDLLRTRQAAAHDAALLAAILRAPLPASGLARPPLPAPPEGDAARLAREAAARQPAVQAAAARLQRARGSAALERARARGDVEATAGYKRTAGLDTAVFGLAFTLPVFERNAAGRARADAEARALELEWEDATARATARLEAFFDAARGLRERAATIERDLITPAELAHRAALSAFNEGRVDALELVDAERVFIEARRAALEIASEAYLALHEAHLIAGRETGP